MKRTFLAIALIAVTLFAAAPRGALGATTPILRISAPSTVQFAQAAAVTVTLSNGATPLSGETIHIVVNSRHRVDLTTNTSGVVVYHFSRSSVPGTYRVTANFSGDPNLQLGSATASTVLVIARPKATSIALSVPGPTKTGQRLGIDVTLTSPSGTLAGQPVRVTVGTLRSLDVIIKDPAGSAHVSLSRDTPAGTYTVTATYHGNRRLSLTPASDSQTLTVLPLTLDVQTLPVLTGAPITLDRATVATDSSGVAHFSVQAAGNHELFAAPPPDTATTKATFARWSDGQIVTSRQLHLLGDTQMLAGYRTSIRTEMRFSNADGKPLDIARVNSVSIASPDGATQVLQAPYNPLWLSFPAPSRAALTLGQPTARFSVVSATYDGISVANRGDDPLLPKPGTPWNIRLRVYSLHVETRHPVLPGSGPHAVRLTPKHGTPLIVALNDQGMATINNLPRDQYTVTVPASAYAPATPVVLSRDQTISVVVVGAQDILIAGLIVVLIVVLMVIVARRPQWLPRFGR